MNWAPVEDNTDGLRITMEMYEEQDNYGTNRRSIRPGKTPLNVFDQDDNEPDDMPPDALAELRFESYRRKLGFPKKTEKSRWDDDPAEHDSSVDAEIVKIMRNSGIDREPVKNPLNSRTTSKTAIKVDKYPVAGVKGVYLTPDHFKFENVYFASKPEKDEEPVKEKGDCATSNTKVEKSSESMAHLKTFKEPKLGVPGEKYVSPAQLYAMKARRNR